MSADKQSNLVKYLGQLNLSLTQPVPAKHSHRKEVYHAYLRLEMRRTQSKLDELAMNAPAKR